MFKIPIALSIFLLLIFLASAQVIQVNPTGSYILKGKKVKPGEKGEHGEIHVKLLSKDKIALSFYLNMGFPAYNSGDFVDTISLRGNNAVYNFNEPESPELNCRLTFSFSKNRVTVRHEAEDYNFSCGFGHGVIANVTMKKLTDKVPEIKNYFD